MSEHRRRRLAREKNPGVSRARSPRSGWKPLRNTLVLVFVSALVFAACSASPSDTSGSETTSGSATTTGQVATTSGGSTSGDSSQKTRVIIAISADQLSLDATEVGTANFPAQQAIYADLTERGKPFFTDGEIHYGIATDIVGSDDAMTWTITIQDGLKFSDGSPLTAEDVAFSLNLIVSPEKAEAPTYAYFKAIKEAVALDDTTVEVHMSEPDALFYQNSPRALIVPKDYYEKVGREGFTANPIAAGPYKIVEWLHDDVLKLEANEYYYQGKPPIDEVWFKVIPEDASRVAALQAGEVDLIQPMPIELIDAVTSDSNLTVNTSPSLDRFFISVNNFQEPFDDLNVRLAMEHAIDRQSIIDQILQGYADIIPGLIVPLEPDYNDSLEPYSYDPDLARQLLADAGYPNGIGDKYGETELACRTGYMPNTEEVCTLMAEMLTDIGIPAAPRIYDVATFVDLSHNQNVAPLAFNGSAGGGSFLGYTVLRQYRACSDNHNKTTPLEPSSNWGWYYCNPDMDAKLYEASQLFATDQDAAIQDIHEAEKIQYDDASMVFLWEVNTSFGLRKNLDFPAPGRYEFNPYYYSWTDNPRLADD